MPVARALYDGLLPRSSVARSPWHITHCNRREMDRHRFSTRTLRRGAIAAALAATTSAWTSGVDLAAQEPAPKATIVRLTTLGLERTTEDEVRVVVYATGPARVGIGDADPTPLTDTLRL